jgi:chromosomal replication initiator protein
MITLRRADFGVEQAFTDEGQMPPPAAQTALTKTPLALRIDFADFATLAENSSAVRAVKRIARAVLLGRHPPVCPLVLHGPPGCGKTQLTASLLRALASGSSTVIVRCESAGELARPETRGEDAGFADRGLQTCDLLVLEDIQHLPDRAADAVCELSDQRASRRRALIVTANVGPAGLTHLPRRLTSRLAAGLVVHMEQLGPASRRVVLKAAAKAKNLRLTADALDLLAAQGVGVRAALGLLQNLAQVAASFPGPLDCAAIEQVRAGTGQPTSRDADVHAIMKRVAVAFGVTDKALLGQSRLRNVLLSRQVAMYLTRDVTGLSLPRIGAAFGRDHTTVLHACRKVEAEIEADAVLAARVNQLRRELG